ncbi:MAG: phosphoglucosamine mutase [Bacteroidales bacterium]|nr:phosphoglucosamine mutase [Bacteroidales bacterium]
MVLIKSISGIRGIIGGSPGDSLTPPDIVRFVTAYADFIRAATGKARPMIVIGRDARTTGEMVSRLVSGTLMGSGADVMDAGLSTTPTIEVAVADLGADGGIIITASHNPEQWNALKLLDARGEFLSARDGNMILDMAEKGDFIYSGHRDTGTYDFREGMIRHHIERILELPWVDRESIRNRDFSVVVDAVNSTGGLAVPELLEALGVRKVTCLFCEPTGRFPHNPEPLPENLARISEVVRQQKADLGVVVDPDVDRLAIITEKGEMFGEEYTLVAAADYILSRKPGNTVSNLSSSMALRDITEKRGGQHFYSAVGEVNVVARMKEMQAVIGGEGNGGVILPDLHYGRDALVGIALFLTWLAKRRITCSELRNTYPDYFISKNKLEIQPGARFGDILHSLAGKYAGYRVDTSDGLRIDLDREWVQVRKSNTEPVMRIYAESNTAESAGRLAGMIMDDIRLLMDPRP